jgi:hypothetical protein
LITHVCFRPRCRTFLFGEGFGRRRVNLPMHGTPLGSPRSDRHRPGRRHEHLVQRRGGRPKGGLNKLTRTLKDMILTSLAMAGGERYLLEQAQKQPGAYLSLIGRVLPLQVKEGGDEPRVPTVVHHRHEPAVLAGNSTVTVLPAATSWAAPDATS